MRRAARNLPISSKKSMWLLKKKLSRWPKSSTSRPCGQRRLDVGEAVGQRERQLLCGGRARLADVVARDRHRMPPGHLGGGELHHVGHDPHRRSWRVDVLLLGLVLLENVVLDRARQLRGGDAVVLGDGDVHGQQDRRRAVDGHRRRDRCEIDVGEEVLHVGERVDGHAGAADLTESPRRCRSRGPSGWACRTRSTDPCRRCEGCP